MFVDEVAGWYCTVYHFTLWTVSMQELHAVPNLLAHTTVIAACQELCGQAVHSHVQSVNIFILACKAMQTDAAQVLCCSSA